jgi:hypothetical protein
MFRAATTRVGRFPGLEVTPNQSREKRIDRTAAYDSNQARPTKELKRMNTRPAGPAREEIEEGGAHQTMFTTAGDVEVWYAAVLYI